MTQLETEPMSSTAPPVILPIAETHPHAHRVVRKVTYGGLLGAIPAGIGFGIATATGSRRGGIVGSALALGAMIVARWQLQRFFTDEPRHRVDATVGKLEIRTYEPRVVACTEVGCDSFEDALDLGFERLFRYIRGHNARGERLAMTVPVTAVRTPAGFLVSFVMPPHHSVASLARPRDMRIELATIPEQRVAALCFRGRGIGNSGLVARQEGEMVRQVLEQGLDTIGETIFAAYDPPSTFGPLRRNEIWMELAP